ncbi:hypothetical protein PR202_ga22676 [Eleusine coracana subsp. coracana]|uniref:Disease resistance protein RPM1 n=1 Tax=Eleusine coracana subsp. coracana TaxID=191504 RepID=A0AAV5D3U2_ELECO|nr:hypothetical protein PR202_ga22676 [Eleusine coracana subsp. coracana]
MHAALCKVAQVPRDQLDEQVNLWARDVRELSYDIEDTVDIFMVRVQGRRESAHPNVFKKFGKMAINLFNKGFRIADTMHEIKAQVQDVADWHDRYKIDSIAAANIVATSIDPRLSALYRNNRELIGVQEARDELMQMLTAEGINVSKQQQLKTISIVGFGGLGKTTLAKAVYDRLRTHFDCRAFVAAGRNPDLKKVFRDILIDIDKQKYMDVNVTVLDERQLINKLRELLQNKRIFGGEGNYPDIDHLSEASDKILKKCGGVPLAIITIASLLATKQLEEWSNLCNSIGFGDEDNKEVKNTREILSFSYYDLPSHLRTCLLYLSVFPEDYFIDKDPLIWKWVAEGFVHEKHGTAGLFETGEGYFNELVNRSMIQAVEVQGEATVIGCRIHDMILDLIRTLYSEQNFVIVLEGGEDNKQQLVSESCNVRRLAIQKTSVEHNSWVAAGHMSQMRSFVASLCDISMKLPLSRFQVLRVLALEYCEFTTESHHLKHLESLAHLRYLGLNHTPTVELPEEIGCLKFLQTLDLQKAGIEELPSSIRQVTQLMCLRGDYTTRAPPDGIISKLTSLEELWIFPASADRFRSFVRELGNLWELRTLRTRIVVEDQGHERALLVGTACAAYANYGL